MHAQQLPVPPHNTEAEMAALGAMLLSRVAADKLLHTLDENDFYSPVHREIFLAMRSIAAMYRPVDFVTLRDELVSRNMLDRIGGLDYLMQIAEAVPSAENADHYASIVLDRAMLRDLERAGDRIKKEVHDPEQTVLEKIQGAERLVFDVSKRRTGRDFKLASDVAGQFFKEVDELLESGQPLQGLPTGLTDLDQRLTGLYDSNLIIVAARPAVGKSSLAHWFAYNAAVVTGKPVAIFSLEMSDVEVIRRFVTMLGKVDSNALKRSNLSDEDYQGIVEGCEKIYPLKIYIDDSADVSTFEVLGKCRRLKAEQGDLAMVVVDYLQLMRATKQNEGRTQQISEIARGLKMIAKELDVPVVALSQLSRNIEQREPPIPQLSDLRESGSIEADADVVLMLYRYQPDDPGEQENLPVVPIDVFIRKNRNGPVGVETLAFEPTFTLFSNAADDLKAGRGQRFSKPKRKYRKGDDDDE
ncbi:MAG: replicative DNA helicase [Armatimonadota bacterium]|nr:replicative DNA helicase [Armatimonadota bacterium]